ncbi:MAG: HD domain-containing phosphohydrolase [Bdellovibrionota bacterium]
MSSWGDVPSWALSAANALMQSLNAVDPLTYHHCCRVGEMSRKLARDSGLNEYEQKVAEIAGLFHDVGKIGISQEIIAKPGKLDPKELDIMRNHPVISEQVIKPLADAHQFFKDTIMPVRGHHERVDGEGYPDRLMGERIPLLSRIILVVDTYDAMSQTRSYRKGLPDDIIYAELKRCTGTQFDPQLIRIFLQAHKTWNALDTDRTSFKEFNEQGPNLKPSPIINPNKKAS